MLGSLREILVVVSPVRKSIEFIREHWITAQMEVNYLEPAAEATFSSMFLLSKNIDCVAISQQKGLWLKILNLRLMAFNPGLSGIKIQIDQCGIKYSENR